jgi:tetratricopeptide (TPR) repeat protein
MLTLLRRPAQLVLVALAATLTPAVAAAQANECPVDLYQPTQLAQAAVFIQQAASATEGAVATKALRDAANMLKDERRFASNPLGLTFAKGQIMILWLHQDPAPVEMTQFELNLGRDRVAKINLLQAADSLLTLVETAQPACASEMDKWRQSRPWNSRISATYRLLAAGNVDSAEVYAKEAYVLDRRSPFIYNAFAQIAMKRNQTDEMFRQLDRAIEIASRDTALAETARQLRTQYAGTLQETAMSETDVAKRNEKLGRAARMYLAIGAEDPASKDGPAYYSAALDIAMLIQDQALIGEIINPMIEDPTPFPDLTLLLAAETSRMLNKNDNAMSLYKGALGKNPNIRDANYFLSYMLLEAKKPAETTALLERLVTIDPGNPDNLMMQTMAVRQVAEAERDARKKADLIRQVNALMARESAMPYRVQVTRFERRAEGAVWSGTVENRANAAKTFTIEVSFLDTEGNVLETQSVTTSSAAANETVPFEVTAVQAGIVAWKYVLK